MSLRERAEIMLPEIERELQSQVARLNFPRTTAFHEMLTYHMGWTGAGAGKEAAGKRIRPLITLLTAEACGADFRAALPAAAAVELIHNFSLAHDDVQDNSEKRRGRLAVWKIWGAPMAINVGDALFILAGQAMLDLRKNFPAETTLRASAILHEACLSLTCGQFLDMSYEGRGDLTNEDYYPMIAGKTSALLAACAEIGALLGDANETRQEEYRAFGHHLGLAFQVQDDILGVWGDEALTGKSAASDLEEGKNSLPILYGIGKGGAFAERWKRGAIRADEAPALAKLLEEEGARRYAEAIAEEQTQTALKHLQTANPQGAAGAALLELANALLGRKQ